MSIYVFDNASRTVIDSSDLTNGPSIGLFFDSGVLHSIEVDAFGKIIIRNFKTGQLLWQYQTNYALNIPQVSADGTKLYSIGSVVNGNSLKILLYDMLSNTEKTIAELPFLPGGGLPFDNFVLSDDNKKMIFQSGNDLYLKVLD